MDNEYQYLIATKQYWIKHYQGYITTLCMAVLEMGQPDDLGNPRGIRLHHMTCKSMTSGDIKVVATEKSGAYNPAIHTYSTIRRVIVTVGKNQPVYITLSNDISQDDLKHNIFVPGVWMDYADQIIKQHERFQEQASRTAEDIAIIQLKKDLLIGVPGFEQPNNYREGATS